MHSELIRDQHWHWLPELSELCSEVPQLPPVELEESKAAAGAQVNSGCRTNPPVLDQAEVTQSRQGFARAALELFVWTPRAVLGVSGKVWSCSVAQVRDLFGRSKFGQLTANCMFLLPSSSSASSNISAPAEAASLTWAGNSCCSSPWGCFRNCKFPVPEPGVPWEQAADCVTKGGE